MARGCHHLRSHGVLIDANSVYERHWQTWAARTGPIEDILAVHHGRPAAQTVEIVAPHLDPPREAAAYNQSLLRTPTSAASLLSPALPNFSARCP